ncbi:hypothetical protein GQ457_05G013290 [Hibiscus cannabinus]
MSIVSVSDTVQGIGCLVLAYALVDVMLCKQSFGPSMVASDMHGVVVVIREMLLRKWEVCFRHINRQANNVADWLTKHKRDKEIGEEMFTLPPPGIQRLLDYDAQVFFTVLATGIG